MTLKQTPAQTVGPFFAYGLTPAQYGYESLTSIASDTLAGAETRGEHIRVEGQVLDGESNPANDAMIEIWQADAEGRYAHPADPRSSNAPFRGFGRVGTGTASDARFFFDTIKPASVDGVQAPHINLIVFMRGLLSHAYTRIYFADEVAANARDPVLGAVPEARRPTLLAGRNETPDSVVYRFDIRMQGAQETVFFDV